MGGGVVGDTGAGGVAQVASGALSHTSLCPLNTTPYRVKPPLNFGEN
jgi:hypothetical protein